MSRASRSISACTWNGGATRQPGSISNNRVHTYILRRVLLAIPTLIGVTILIFVAMRVIPGDPIAMITSEGGMNYTLSEEEIETVRNALGLNRPYHEQYLSWMGDVVSGELGRSFWRQEPIRDQI